MKSFKLSFATGLSLVCISSQCWAQEMYHVGVGNVPCSEYNTSSDGDKLVVHQWAFGYLSGSSGYEAERNSRFSENFRSADRNQIYAAIGAYCLQDPLKQVAHAVNDVKRQLGATLY